MATKHAEAILEQARVRRVVRRYDFTDDVINGLRRFAEHNALLGHTVETRGYITAKTAISFSRSSGWSGNESDWRDQLEKHFGHRSWLDVCKDMRSVG